MSIKPLVYIFSWGYLLGLLFIPIFKGIASRYKILISNKGMPLVGGVSIALSFILSSVIGFSFYGDQNINIIGVVLSSLLMLIFGIIDDLKELSVFIKFFVQIIATSLLVVFGVRTHIIYIGDFFNIIITFIWVLGITNAFNHLDISDGLCGGISMIVSLSFFVIALLNNDLNMAILFLALAAAIFGFLIFNFPPAKVYMGNSGSHFIGFTLAASAMLISYAPLERKIALFTPLLILGLPIYDTTLLIFTRLKNKRSIFRKSLDHLTFRFLDAGYSNKKTLLSMYALGLFFSFSGILTSQLPNQIDIAVIIVVIFVSLIVGKRMIRNSKDA